VTIDTKTGQAQLREFAGAIDGVGKSAETVAPRFGGMVGQIGAAILAAGLFKRGFDLAKGVLKDSIKEAADYEKALTGLNAAFLISGRTMPGMTKHLQDYADEMQSLGLADDAAILKAQSLMMTLTSLDEKGLKAATRGAIGLSSVFEMDLSSAAEMVAKGMEGNYQMLGRMIPAVRNATTEEGKHAAMMKTFEDLYKQAIAATGTYSGQVKTLGLEWGEAKKRMGEAALSTGILQSAMDGLSLVVKNLGPTIDGMPIEEWRKKTKALNEANNEAYEIIRKVAAETGRSSVAVANEALQYHLSYVQLLEWIKAGDWGVLAKEKMIKAIDEHNKKLKEEKAGYTETGPVVSDFGKRIDELKKSLGVTFTSDTRKKIEDIQFALKHMALTEDSIKKLKAELAGLLQAVANSQGFLTVFRGQWGDVKNELDLVVTKKTEIADWVQTKLPLAYKAGMAKILLHLKEYSGANKIAAEAVAEAWRDALEKKAGEIQQAVQRITGAMSATYQQFYQNQTIRIENEYAKKKQYILATVKDEEKKNAALQALDQEMDLQKRSSMRKYAAAAKAVALMEAAVNTAAAATSALKTPPPWVGMAMAITIGLLGAARMAAIAAQPIPLAKGAIFNRRTLLTADTGSQYEVAEAGEPEILASPRQLRQAIAGGRGRGRESNRISITVPIYIAGQKISEQIINLIQEADALGKLRLRRAVA
jgi:hypothetical protein